MKSAESRREDSLSRRSRGVIYSCLGLREPNTESEDGVASGIALWPAAYLILLEIDIKGGYDLVRLREFLIMNSNNTLIGIRWVHGLLTYFIPESYFLQR